MRYLGGKAQGGLGRQIVDEILLRVPPEHRFEYLEPFLGGCNVLPHAVPHFQKTYAGDVHEDLILMWQAVAAGWVPPSLVTESEYQVLRQERASALRGFAGFAASFGGKWFGGYARGAGRNWADEGARGLCKLAPRLQGTHIANVRYQDWPVVPGVVLYCDPPYLGTTGYKGTEGFDHPAFWSRMREWSDAGSYVFVSEGQAPVDWPCIWEKPRKSGPSIAIKALRQERLFFKAPKGL